MTRSTLTACALAAAVAVVVPAATATAAGGPAIHVSPTRIGPTKPVTVTFRTQRRLKAHEFYSASIGRPKPFYPPTCVDSGRSRVRHVTPKGVKVTIVIRPIGPLGPGKRPNTWCPGPASVSVTIERQSGGTTIVSDSDGLGDRKVRFLRP